MRRGKEDGQDNGRIGVVCHKKDPSSDTLSFLVREQYAAILESVSDGNLEQFKQNFDKVLRLIPKEGEKSFPFGGTDVEITFIGFLTQQLITGHPNAEVIFIVLTTLLRLSRFDNDDLQEALLNANVIVGACETLRRADPVTILSCFELMKNICGFNETHLDRVISQMFENIGFGELTDRAAAAKSDAVWRNMAHLFANIVRCEPPVEVQQGIVGFIGECYERQKVECYDANIWTLMDLAQYESFYRGGIMNSLYERGTANFLVDLIYESELTYGDESLTNRCRYSAFVTISRIYKAAMRLEMPISDSSGLIHTGIIKFLEKATPSEEKIIIVAYQALRYMIMASDQHKQEFEEHRLWVPISGSFFESSFAVKAEIAKFMSNIVWRVSFATLRAMIEEGELIELLGTSLLELEFGEKQISISVSKAIRKVLKECLDHGCAGIFGRYAVEVMDMERLGEMIHRERSDLTHECAILESALVNDCPEFFGREEYDEE